MTSRTALFISHASPEDNAFTRWLGAKLAAMGYEVWADVMQLHGGSAWARELEEALRNRTIKMLLVCTELGLDKDGVRNEIEIGSYMSRQLNDREFIIPLRLEPYIPHFQIVQTQYIDFSKSWAIGLAELIELLENTYKIPRQSTRLIDEWLTVQSFGSARLFQSQEPLISNWLELCRLPQLIRYYEPPLGFPQKDFQERSFHKRPIVPLLRGILTFEKSERNGYLESGMPAMLAGEILTSDFIDNGWATLDISPYEARKNFSDLGNQAFEIFLKSKNLSCSQGTRDQKIWWGDIRTVPLAKIRFDWPQQKGQRQVIGQSEKRGIHWHYGISAQVRTSPINHLKISSKLIFSKNGLDAIQDIKKSHQLRRSFAKSWRNARWRDMQLAFLWWLADGLSEIELKVSSRDQIVLKLPNMSFDCPVSVMQANDDFSDDDDPDIEPDEWDESVEETPEDEDIEL